MLPIGFRDFSPYLQRISKELAACYTELHSKAHRGADEHPHAGTQTLPAGGQAQARASERGKSLTALLVEGALSPKNGGE
jgi:hypothetical protein